MLNSNFANKIKDLLKCFQDSNSEEEKIIHSRMKNDKHYKEKEIEEIISQSINLEFIVCRDGIIYKNISIESSGSFYRNFIKKYIEKNNLHGKNSYWSRIKDGRIAFFQELKKHDPNLYQLMCYAELEDAISIEIAREIASWWDDFASHERTLDNQKKMVTGRNGEQLSLKYEKIQIDNLAKKYGLETKNPSWEALDENDSGYDIGSFTIYDDAWCDKKVEVKSTESDSGIFSFSRNQFFTMRTFKKTYEVHLWKLNQMELAILTWDDLSHHMPVNNGKGSWTAVEIKFSEFEHKFKKQKFV